MLLSPEEKRYKTYQLSCSFGCFGFALLLEIFLSSVKNLLFL